jgi:hypothetical protein
MIVTARQLQQLQGNAPGGEGIVLPYGARLTPLAQELARAKGVKIGYGPAESAAPQPQAAGPAALLWWCDGSCGAAKAALAVQARESNLAPIPLPNNPANLASAIKSLASQIKSGHAAGGLLLLQSAAEAIVYANRCPSIRAIVGTCPESIDRGTSAVAANVLAVEYPRKSFAEIRNLLSRFAAAKRTLCDETRHRLEEMASCA